jgi:hypothetical protein
VDGHADTSGKSESSGESASTGDGKADIPPGLEAFEEEIQEELDELKGDLEGRRARKRQQSTLRRKIDEMVLVGKGAPA